MLKHIKGISGVINESVSTQLEGIILFLKVSNGRSFFYIVSLKHQVSS